MLELGLAFLLATSEAPQAPPRVAEISARVGEEDGRREVIATVREGGKPIPSVGVSFRLVRSFGDLPLGEDTTLDDGTAAAPLPRELRPSEGGWSVKISLTSPEVFAGQSRELSLAAPSGCGPTQPPRHRELWSRDAPFSLVLTVLILVGGAWAVFAFTCRQLLAIRREGKGA